MSASLTLRLGFLDSIRLVSLQNIVEQKYAATTPTVADFTTIGAKSQVRVSRILQRFIGHPVLENEFVKKLFVQKSVKVGPAPLRPFVLQLQRRSGPVMEPRCHDFIFTYYRVSHVHGCGEQ